MCSFNSFFLRCCLVLMVALAICTRSATSHEAELATLENGVADRQHNASGFVGSAATLPCEIDEAHCGRVYLVTWTKLSSTHGHWERVYLFSSSSTVNRVLGPLAHPDRAAFHAGNGTAHLRIQPLHVTDDGTYKCDVTYVQGECPSLSFTHLQTLVEPQEPVMRLDGRSLEPGALLGPFIEGQTVVLECASTQGRPASLVSWRNGSSPLPVKTSRQTHPNGLSDVVAIARFVVSRWDLGARLQCVVESRAAPGRLSGNALTLDVHVRPVSLNLRGPSHPVVAGEMVSLTCVVDGAKPAANITWYNRSELVSPQPVSTEEPLEDGTFRTTSTIVFIATQFDHQSEYFCKGMNQVLKNRTEAPLLQAVRLEVLYPPAVIMRPLEGVNVSEGQAANVSCQYNANPPNISEVTWYKDGHVLAVDRRRHDRPLLRHQVALFRIHNVSRDDQGAYSCHVRNAFGTGNSSNAIQLDVFYRPSVSAWLSPSVISIDEGPLTLRCDVISGHPPQLIRVRWLKDGTPFFETAASVLELSPVNKSLSGAYQCLALNAAGWSELSEDARPLTVMYPPGLSQIRVISPEQRPAKGERVELECAVDDPGFPPAASFEWFHNGTPVLPNASGNSGPDEILQSDRLLTPPLSVVSQGNYSCAAVNQIGRGLAQGLTLHPMVPPAFIKPLAQSGGARVMNHSVVYLECVVECVPQCHIWWKRNNRSIHVDYGHHLPRHWEKEHRNHTDRLLDQLFKVRATTLPASVRQGHFAAVKSVLYWNLTELAETGIEIDGNTFTCESSGNEVGQGISSSIRFKLEYGPESVSLSSDEVELLEGHSLTPDSIICSATGNPAPSIVWTLRGRIVSTGPRLTLPSPLSRHASGNYTCTASNKYGERSASASINVLHRPECVILKEEDSTGDIILTCEVTAAPPVLGFSWHHNNRSLSEENLIAGDTRSVLVLQQPDSFGQYSCVAANQIGPSEPCLIRLTRLPTPAGWVNLFLKEENVLVLTLALAAIVIVAVMVFVALAFIRKKSEAKPRIHRENARLVLMDETLPHMRAEGNIKSQLLLPDGTPLIFTPQGRATTLPPAEPLLLENPYQNISEYRTLATGGLASPYERIGITGQTGSGGELAIPHGAKLATLATLRHSSGHPGLQVATDENNYALPGEASTIQLAGIPARLALSKPASADTKPSLTINRLHAVNKADFARVPLEERGGGLAAGGGIVGSSSATGTQQRRQRTLQHPVRTTGGNLTSIGTTTTTTQAGTLGKGHTGPGSITGSPYYATGDIAGESVAAHTLQSQGTRQIRRQVGGSGRVSPGNI
ncbi:hemicentin-2-like isoform X1 [Varroa destructor]|uniref:Ig-like domain-containing protein n=1 Tax=Varroa destructor TaxID=109461 RepID=A0A7M7MD53_VARDE|nr:hemicentin-2-like isoform X1 [Varroa destructor]